MNKTIIKRICFALMAIIIMGLLIFAAIGNKINMPDIIRPEQTICNGCDITPTGDDIPQDIQAEIGEVVSQIEIEVNVNGS